MTTDKSKWWQGWVVYGFVGLLVIVGPYLSGYMLLGEYDDTFPGLGAERDFQSNVLMYGFSPIGVIEAKIRGEDVLLGGANGDCIHIKAKWPFGG